MGSRELYGLDVLSNEDALSLFALHEIGERNFDKHPTFKLLGEGIVRKCGKLPLALKTLGGVLNGKRNIDEWDELLKSEIWDIKDDSEILPALRLSYHHLPPHLKQLFAYCSLIPKDYVFDRNILVLLWMAEGYLSQSKGNKSKEHLGHHYFDELKSKSFIQHSTDGELGYKMHDLINDLATSVAGEFSFRLDAQMDVSDINETFDKFRHFSLVDFRSESYRKLMELQRAKHLRTFLMISAEWENDGVLEDVLNELLPKLQVLRVLTLSGMESNRSPNVPSRYIPGLCVMITKVPQSISNLKHLRYLNFSYTGITCFPEQVSNLYNLQSLLVHNCERLYSLPQSFAKLINLRHLDISDTPNLQSIPLGISGLTSPQTLTKVIVEGANRFKISDLKGLADIQGRLSIIGLEKVIDPIQAMDANLHQTKDLDSLEMKWSDELDDSRNEMIEYEVLKELRPPPLLKKLKILFNKGTKFPSWIDNPSFDWLTELTICGCRSPHLPTLGLLGSLRKLLVERMSEVKSVGFKLLAHNNVFTGIAFPSLEVLEFVDMQGWQKWSNNIDGDHGSPISFPRLHKISIKCCPKLAEVSIGLIPSLRVLHIIGCSKAVFRSMVGLSLSLVELEIWSVEGLTQLHGEDLMHLGAVKEVVIGSCDEVRYLWQQDMDACKSLVSLQTLEVYHCKKLVSLAEKEVSFGINMKSLKQVKLVNCEALESYNCPYTVESLTIDCCSSLTSLTFSTVNPHASTLSKSIVGDCDSIQPISRLTSLTIIGCENLKFPHEHLHNLTTLEEMWIYGCPSMDNSFPCELCPKIRDIEATSDPSSNLTIMVSK